MKKIFYLLSLFIFSINLYAADECVTRIIENQVYSVPAESTFCFFIQKQSVTKHEINSDEKHKPLCGFERIKDLSCSSEQSGALCYRAAKEDSNCHMKKFAQNSL